LDSPGPVFFTQERVGRDGRTFRLVKFRSMRTTAEAELASEPQSAESDRPAHPDERA
ncbi:sugar transferase, partial [Microbacterium sp. SA075R]|uniref:sugar transferase n=1 Tax=Microbacterium sp. SA075R TaxID=3121522 RepID=UPI003BA22C60